MHWNLNATTIKSSLKRSDSIEEIGMKISAGGLCMIIGSLFFIPLSKNLCIISICLALAAVWFGIFIAALDKNGWEYGHTDRKSTLCFMLLLTLISLSGAIVILCEKVMR